MHILIEIYNVVIQINELLLFWNLLKVNEDDGDRSIKIFDPETGRMIKQIGPRIGFGRKLGYM